MIQFYGNFAGYWSHSQVSRGIVAGLYHSCLQDAQVYNTHRYGGYEGLSESFTDGGYNVSLPSGWYADAPIGFFVGGYPPQMREWLDGHEFKAALFIAESSVLPRDWVAYASKCDLVAVPSAWTMRAYTDAGLDPRKILIVPHGLHPVYQYGARAKGPERGPWRFLHIPGARDFLDRKGTPQLIAAFRQVFTADEAVLTIRTPYNPDLTAETDGDHRFDIQFADAPLTPPEMLALLQQGWHAYVAPSRAEAFGMIPVEARATGLPVIATHCAGHREHAHPADVKIAHGPEAPIRVNGIPNGRAPSVSVDAVARGLMRFVTSKADHSAPGGYARRWGWPDICRPLATRLREMLRTCEGRRTTIDEGLLGG